MLDYPGNTANQLFWAMITAAHRKGEGSPDMLRRTLIGIDPGETTGFGYRRPDRKMFRYDEDFHIYMDQIATKDRNSGAEAIKKAILGAVRLDTAGQAPLIICEDYRVYAHKSDQHKWAGLHTPKLIGHIERIAYELEIPVVYPMAIEGKTWATDDMLKQWGLYNAGMKHARDASRHIVTRAFFGKDTI